MDKRAGYAVALGALGMYAALCAVDADFARAALNGVSLPAMAWLHRLTAPIPFPAAEALAMGIIAVALFELARALRAFDPKALRRCAAGLLCAALALGGLMELVWLPAVAAPREAPPQPDANQLEWLCAELIDALNASPLAFPDAAESLAAAPDAAGLPGRAVKAARWPEWMRAFHICGLFVPLTGEVLADAGAPAPLVPFTAVHELMHLSGIGDEGAANIAAWRLCLSAGGAFADSARLWALRYALGMLARADAPARLRCHERMKDPLRQVFHEINGEAAARGDYMAMVGALCD